MPPGLSFKGDEPYISFLAVYPFAAFVLDGRNKHRTQLLPVYANTAYYHLIHGPESTAVAQSAAPINPALLGQLSEVLADANEVQRLVTWLEPKTETNNIPEDSLITLSFRPSWISPNDPPLQKIIVKTFMEGFWVCTTIPLKDVPVDTPPPPSTLASLRPQNLRIPHFPPPPTPSFFMVSSSGAASLRDNDLFTPRPLSSSNSPKSAPIASQASHATNTAASNLDYSHSVPLSDPVEKVKAAINHPLPKRPGEMARMLENYPWEKTVLGPRSQWCQSLKTAVSICIQSPEASSLWWGPELILIYNDQYADMAHEKHPRMFGKSAFEAWGEVGHFAKELGSAVLKGKSAAVQDELQFLQRLTSSDLPEEVYHTWSSTPVKGEHGTVVGLLFSSMETTRKVIAERRLSTLRTFGERAKLSKDAPQLTTALLSVLEQNREDVPFTAFYCCQTPSLIRKEDPYRDPTQYLGKSTNDRASPQLSLRLAGTIGVPDGHISTPSTLDISLDRCMSQSYITPRPAGGSIGPSELGDTRISSPVSPGSLHSGPPLCARTTRPTLRKGTSFHSDSTHHTNHSCSTAASRIASPFYYSSSPSYESIPPSSISGSSSAPWMWPIAEAISSRRPLLVPTLPCEVAEGLSRRSWGDLPRQAIVIPIWSYEGGTSNSDLTPPQAVLILGVNPRRPYDKDYEEWIDLLSTSLGVSLAAVLSWEAETQRAEKLAQLDAAKTSFFSNVSHELRTPLTLIMGPIQDALSGVRDPKIKETLQLASRNASRLSRLVDSLMDFTRIEAGKLLGNFKPVQLGAFTADLSALFRSTIETSKVKFNVDCDTTSPVLCYVDPDFWEKIVFNLIGNAFKYTMQGAISVRLSFINNEVKFEVEDTGVGIPLEDQEKVFQRFHRVASISRSQEGTGIGLSLTRELVRLHRGTITIQSYTEEESPDGSHGSTFTVLIPLGKDHLPAAHVHDTMAEEHRHRHYARGIVEEATHWTQHMEMVKTPSDLSEYGGSSEGCRLDASTIFFTKKDILLIVDDSNDMRQFIKSIFAELCSVVEATNGQEALQIIDNGVRPTLILTDVMMPVLDGYGLMKAIRERPDTKLIPLIFLTAKAGEEARVDGLLSGADDYIAKPFRGRELVARVHLQMQLGKRRAELEARFDERQREVQILSDHSPIGIVRTNADGTVIYYNTRWTELTGGSGSGDGNKWLERVYPDDLEAVVALWKGALNDRRESSLEFRWKNGVWTKGQVVPLGNDQASLGGILFTITDISDQRLYEASQLLHAQEREATARRQAEEAEARRKEAEEQRKAQELLIDITSHELRQPVSAILNCSALVKDNLSQLQYELDSCYSRNVNFVPSPSVLSAIKEDLEALDSIYQCGLAQEQIANDVLSLSRIQLQVLSIHPVEYELVPEIKRVIAIFHNELKRKRIAMHLRVGDSIAKYNIQRIRSDKSRLAQILTNLLSNAIKFADTSKEKREIHVEVEVSFNPPREGTCLPPIVDQIPKDPATILYLYFSVRDSGPGLKPDDLTLLFKRFQQGSNSHDVLGGSGLGLFVSRKLCNLMNGHIEVDRTFGQGATFRFYIQANNSPVTSDIGITQQSVVLEDDRPRPSMFGNHIETNGARNGLGLGRLILITEDNPINQTVLNRQLKAAGFTTMLASNGQQAIDIIINLAKEQKQFDAILMDCQMPVMDGITAVREIRRLEAAGVLPGRNRIYALTANARAGQIESARDAGMTDVLIKPYKLYQLVEKLCNGP